MLSKRPRLLPPAGISGLLPELGPWTEAALWHGLLDVPTPDSRLELELQTILEHRLGPLLLSYLSSGQREAPADCMRILREDSFRRLEQSIVVLHRGAAVVAALHDAGIGSVVSKGPGIARLYESAELRPFADIDLLVKRSEFPRAMRVLANLGYVERSETQQPWSYFDRYCREGVNLRSPDGGSVDLHHHVPPWFWGRRLSTDDLVEIAARQSFVTVDLPCVSTDVNLLIACLHIVSDKNAPGATLLIWRDIAQLVAAADPVEVEELAREAGLLGWVGATLRALPRPLRPAELIALCERDPKVHGALRLRLLLRLPSQRDNVMVSQVLRLPLTHGGLYIAGMLFPSRRFLVTRAGAENGISYRSWWKHGWRSHLLARTAPTQTSDEPGSGYATHRPKVVYWSNQPTPYTVGRLNAVAALNVLDLRVWFDEVRQPDRSWDIDPSEWNFPYEWVPQVRLGPWSLRLPVDLLRRERPDLVVQLFDRPGTALGALVTRTYASRLAFRVLPAYRSWGVDTPFTRTAKRFLFRSADAVKVPGPAGKAFANRWGMPGSRCFTTAQTIDVSHYGSRDSEDPDVRELRGRLMLKETTFVYVGRLWSGKGLDYLIDAFKRLRGERDDVSLLLIGDGVDGRTYERLAAGVADVHFAGFVQPASLPMYYAACDVLVLPTLGDPHGLVVEEAMAAGLAVISSEAAGDIRARVEQRKAGRVVRAADATSLYESMAQLADNRYLTKQLAKNGKESVADLTHDAYAKDFIAFTQAVLATRRRRTTSSLLARLAGRLVAAGVRPQPPAAELRPPA